MGYRTSLLTMVFAASGAMAQAPESSFISNGFIIKDGAPVMALTGEPQTAGECLSHAALVSAHPGLREEGLVIAGRCEETMPSTPSRSFSYMCDGSRDAAAADRLFALGAKVYVDKQPIDLNAQAVADVKKICETSTLIEPATRLLPATTKAPNV